MAMLVIPFIRSPGGNACALASYTMVAKYFFPETSLEKISKISHWEPRYVVWAFKFWLWLMDKVVPLKITESFVIFHDPDFGPARKVTKYLFEKSWLEIAEPELCIYQQNSTF